MTATCGATCGTVGQPTDVTVTGLIAKCTPPLAETFVLVNCSETGLADVTVSAMVACEDGTTMTVTASGGEITCIPCVGDDPPDPTTTVAGAAAAR